MNELSADDRKHIRRDLWLAALLLTAGLVTIGLSLAELRAEAHTQVAQATGTPGQPLQATPSPTASPTSPPAEPKPPAEAKPGGTRPTTPAPEPARPNPQAQKEGAKPALPPAPAEKVAPPIPEKK